MIFWTLKRRSYKIPLFVFVFVRLAVCLEFLSETASRNLLDDPKNAPKTRFFKWKKPICVIFPILFEVAAILTFKIDLSGWIGKIFQEIDTSSLKAKN